MARARPTGSDDSDLFFEAVAGVAPLGDRDRVSVAKPQRVSGKSLDEDGSPALEVERDGDRIVGRSSGVSRRQLRDLRRISFIDSETLDLHGLPAARARAELARFLNGASERGARHVLVVTGKGRHSVAGPVLRDAAADELAGPQAARVAGFITAGHRQGGTGALCVLLRKR